ncbi:MAG TPA: hypothetical protein VFJ82_07815 [Longimicrobium sp.]|nr:hypothetical protein [Longimicrobium sp.]
MKKITLDVEALEVHTFEVAVTDEQGGTVEGYFATKIQQNTCDPNVGTCFGYTCLGAGVGCSA